MREILDRIEESIVEKFDNNLAKMFVMEAGTTLLNNGITLWYTQKPIDTKVEKTESGMVYTDTYEIKFDGIDTSEHDEKIREEVIETLAKSDVREKIIEGHVFEYSIGYEDGIADERDRILSIVSSCIAHNVYNVSEGIALLNAIKEEVQNGKKDDICS